MTASIIIGGGAIGLSLAYHLSRRGHQVTLLERGKLTSGTSWHAAGIVGPLRATPNITKLTMYALELFPKLEQETGFATGYRRTGGYWLARAPERMDELHRIAALGRHLGLDAAIIAPGEVAIPGLDLSAHVGALKVAEDASVDPVDLCMAYARAASADIREESPVSEIVVENGAAVGVRLASGEVLRADQVALCAGAWSRTLAAKAGLALPLQPVEHMYVVTEPVPGIPDPFPVLRDLDRGVYIKGDAGRLVIGGFESDAKCWDPEGPEGDRPFLELPEDWEQFAPFMEAALDLMPALAEIGVQRFMNGPESFTSDTRPLIGEAPGVDGLFVAAGMNSVGVMSSAGVGRILADWMADGVAPMDLWEVDVARADPRAAEADHMAERMQEAVADQFAVHWPFKQPKAGRGLRKSALHDRWVAAGAHFGLTGGWERGLWYAETAEEASLPYSVAAPHPWQQIAEREAAAMEEGCALIDLSPFGKFDVIGYEALEALQELACANLDVAEGRAVYTPLLNAMGGIEADVTITRLGEHAFRITSAAATRWRDAAFLRRHLAGRADLQDVTEDYSVIGVMGAASRRLLEGLSEGDWTAFLFSTARPMTVAEKSVLATRLSFVGELGWELTIRNDDAPVIFDALLASGARPMGHYALEACRIEKGFHAWGHDLGPEVTPLEAGLGFTIDWSKPFIGKDALEAQRAKGLSRRLVLMEVDAGALILHDEPVWANGEVVGLTTSGGIGARTGLTLAFAMIETEPGETLGQTCERRFELEVGARRYAARSLRRPPFDPDGQRMRA